MSDYVIYTVLYSLLQNPIGFGKWTFSKSSPPGKGEYFREVKKKILWFQMFCLYCWSPIAKYIIFLKRKINDFLKYIFHPNSSDLEFNSPRLPIEKYSFRWKNYLLKSTVKNIEVNTVQGTLSRDFPSWKPPRDIK